LLFLLLGGEGQDEGEHKTQISFAPAIVMRLPEVATRNPFFRHKVTLRAGFSSHVKRNWPDPVVSRSKALPGRVGFGSVTPRRASAVIIIAWWV